MASAVEILQRLIRFDTTNPPGNEGDCISYVRELLEGAGIETSLEALEPERPNLVARLPGSGAAPPLLLYGHVDVVGTAGQRWREPPFEGRIADGYVWGRGALDMKGGMAMMLAALLRAKQEDVDLPGDVVFAALSDEEAGSDRGARYLVDERPELFDGVRFALGEFGGFTFYSGGRRFYPIQVAEKQVCWLAATVRGPGGHGSRPVRSGATAGLAELLRRLDRKRLPVHVTGPARAMIETIASSQPPLRAAGARLLLRPALTDRLLDLGGEEARLFDPLLHNTVSPTVLRGSDKINVIPSEATVELDGRLLPGFGPEDLVREVRAVVGDEVELEVLRHDPGPPEPDMGLFDVLADVLRELDPEGVPLPMLLPATTDARFFARLGIQTYGFLPMRLPPDFDFLATIHAADERAPVEGLDFGTEAVYRALQRFGA